MIILFLISFEYLRITIHIDESDLFIHMDESLDIESSFDDSRFSSVSLYELDDWYSWTEILEREFQGIIFIDISEASRRREVDIVCESRIFSPPPCDELIDTIIREDSRISWEIDYLYFFWHIEYSGVSSVEWEDILVWCTPTYDDILTGSIEWYLSRSHRDIYDREVFLEWEYPYIDFPILFT